MNMHIPAALLMDLQALFYPNTYLPGIVDWYIEYSNDPVIGGVARGEKEFFWLKNFLTIEM